MTQVAELMKSPRMPLKYRSGGRFFLSALKGDGSQNIRHNPRMSPACALEVYSPPSEADSARRAPDRESPEPHWERTRLVEERLPSFPAHDGRFQGRKIVHQDSPIAGRVCLGAFGREAVVVDWRHEGNPRRSVSLATLYDAAVQRATVEGRFRKSVALKAVFDTVNEHFVERSAAGVSRLNHQLGAGPDTKVHIDCYIRARVGVCRHMALTCAAILERMVESQLLGGKVSHDRNSIPGKGAHAWCRYTSSSGAIVILDPMQEFFGTLEESRDPSHWDYARPEERTRAA